MENHRDTVAADRLSEPAALDLAAVITGRAVAQAQLDHELLTRVAEFDAGEGARWFSGIRDTAHWLAWACSMSPGTAREHVRVARALRDMPRVNELMSQGRLSYSKVREMTRVLGVVDEQRLCELALAMTAAQLARVVRTFRAQPGTRVAQERQRRFSWREEADGMVRLTVCVPADEAAVLRGAIDRAVAAQIRENHEPDHALAVVDVARAAVSAGPEEPEALRHTEEPLVVVHVDAAVLEAADSGSDVPAGTAHVESAGPIEGATASRLACTGSVVGARVDSTGAVLSYGRRRRLVSRAQRRALAIEAKDMCEYPGCSRTVGLDAHHAIPWSLGGPTDLANLALLCRFHHTFVHEGGVRLESAGADQPEARWRFVGPDGVPIEAPGDPGWWHRGPDDELIDLLQRMRRAGESDPALISPVGGGEGFLLHECVGVLAAA